MSKWLLLRGLMRETRHWGDFVPLLQSHFPQDEIICLEWPGNGVLHQQHSFTQISKMAGYIEQSLDKISHTGQYHVVAMSLGAMAALQWAVEQPTRLLSCTLINTSLRGYSKAYQRLNYQQLGRLLQILAATPCAREKAILALTSQTRPTQVLAQWQQYAQQYPVSRRNALRQLWAASQYRPPAAAPAVPLLLLNSLGDQLVQPGCSATIAQAWNCPLRTHPWAGHDLSLDDPAWLIDAIQTEFFK